MQPEKAARIISQSWIFFRDIETGKERGKKKKKRKEVLRATRSKDRICVPLGER